jgi:hypothetical protein
MLRRNTRNESVTNWSTGRTKEVYAPRKWRGLFVGSIRQLTFKRIRECRESSVLAWPSLIRFNFHLLKVALLVDRLAVRIGFGDSTRSGSTVDFRLHYVPCGSTHSCYYVNQTSLACLALEIVGFRSVSF